MDSNESEKLWNYLNEFWLVIIVFLVFVFVVIFFLLLEKKPFKKERKFVSNVLICPIRGILKRGKYATNGNYSEEYQTIRLVKFFLGKGYRKEQIIFEHVIRIGRDGHNSLRVDLAIINNGKFFVVAEVKNNSREIKSAIKHQLLPAMSILNAKHGIYFDGSKKSRIYARNKNGLLICKPFP